MQLLFILLKGAVGVITFRRSCSERLVKKDVSGESDLDVPLEGSWDQCLGSVGNPNIPHL